MPLPLSSIEQPPRPKSTVASILVAPASREFFSSSRTTPTSDTTAADDLIWATTSGGRGRMRRSRTPAMRAWLALWWRASSCVPCRWRDLPWRRRLFAQARGARAAADPGSPASSQALRLHSLGSSSLNIKQQPARPRNTRCCRPPTGPFLGAASQTPPARTVSLLRLPLPPLHLRADLGQLCSLVIDQSNTRGVFLSLSNYPPSTLPPAQHTLKPNCLLFLP